MKAGLRDGARSEGAALPSLRYRERRLREISHKVGGAERALTSAM
jgi:hypothetical protein